MKGEGWWSRATRAALLGLCLVAGLAQAEVEVPPLQHRVTDLTGTLTAQQQSELEANLAAFEARKGSQIAILLVPTTQPEDIAQYAIRVVDQWKLGRKGVDDGVLVLLAKDDRKSRIEVGYGLEGALNDAKAKRILMDVMSPHFKRGDFHAGLTAGVQAIEQVIDGEPLPEPPSSAGTGKPDGFEHLIPLFFATLVVGSFLRALVGGFVGGLVTGGLAGWLLWMLGAVVGFAAIFGFAVFLFVLLSGMQGMGGGYSGGGYSGGGGGGGFSGGGGGFGGGGASGDW